MFISLCKKLNTVLYSEGFYYHMSYVLCGQVINVFFRKFFFCKLLRTELYIMFGWLLNLQILLYIWFTFSLHKKIQDWNKNILEIENRCLIFSVGFALASPVWLDLNKVNSFLSKREVNC